ncbi:PDK repeat-containing protein, partial [Thermoplasmatales archaeon SCGC AB-539-N05]
SNLHLPINFTFIPGHPECSDVVEFYDQSIYPEGAEFSWLWDFGDGYLSVLQNPIHCYYFDGIYDVTLNIYDVYGGEINMTKTIVVSESPVNIPPEADFSYSPIFPIFSEQVQFTDQSYDPDGDIISYEWDFDDGGTSTSQNPVHAFTEEGTYTVTLTVMDNDEVTDVKQKTIMVYIERPNMPPIADFSYSPVNPDTSDLIQFTDESSDLDGTVIDWFWDFGDGATSTLQNPTHQYMEDGTYIVTLTVRDDNDAQSETYQQPMTISNIPPIADFDYTMTLIPSGGGSSITNTQTFYSTNSDGESRARGIRYQKVIDAENGEYVSYNVNGIAIGQKKERSNYECYRGFLLFD